MTTTYKVSETVTTYADGFGRWYARVDFAPGYSPEMLDRHIDRIRAKARRHIRAEIIERTTGPIAPVRVEITDDLWRAPYRNGPDHMNVWWSITYREKD